MNYVVYMNEVPDIVFHLFLFGWHRLLGMVDPSLGLFWFRPRRAAGSIPGYQVVACSPSFLRHSSLIQLFLPLPHLTFDLQFKLHSNRPVSAHGVRWPRLRHLALVPFFFFFLFRHYLQGPSPRAVVSTLVTHSRLSLTPTLAQSNWCVLPKQVLLSFPGLYLTVMSWWVLPV